MHFGAEQLQRVMLPGASRRPSHWTRKVGGDGSFEEKEILQAISQFACDRDLIHVNISHSTNDPLVRTRTSSIVEQEKGTHKPSLGKA